MSVAANVKSYLDDKGIKQTAVSKKTGIAAAKLNLILNEKQRLTMGEYLSICSALCVPPDTFLAKEA